MCGWQHWNIGSYGSMSHFWKRKHCSWLWPAAGRINFRSILIGAFLLSVFLESKASLIVNWLQMMLFLPSYWHNLQGQLTKVPCFTFFILIMTTVLFFVPYKSSDYYTNRMRLRSFFWELSCSFPPKTKLYTLYFSNLPQDKHGFILECLYHLNVLSKPCTAEPSALPTSIWGLACEDLLLWWQQGSMWRDVRSYRALLISRVSFQDSAEGQLHNRTIHHTGPTHLSHV